MSRATLEAQTELFFSALKNLRADTPETFESIGLLFEDDCIANPISMREHLGVAKGRQEVVKAYKELNRQSQLVERRTLSQIIDEGQRMVACEMKNRLRVNGQVLDPFYETAIITFSATGRIASLNMYSCRSPVVALLQKTTGLGPYSDVRTLANASLLT
jgi:hypothetical protein